MIIREMKADDVIQVSELEKKYFSIPWSYDSLMKEVNNAGSIFCVAVEDEKVVGYGGMLLVIDEGDITNIVVEENYRGKSIGKGILDYFFKEGGKRNIESFTLEVRVSNENAKKLYEKMGFVSEGVRKRFYEHPVEDALIMWKRK